MKLSGLFAILLTLAAGITAHALLHLRVHIMEKVAALYEQCEWESRAVICDKYLLCQRLSTTFGWCLKANPGLGDQCGGNSTNGPWSNPCNGSELECVYVSDEYSKCQKKTDSKMIKMAHHHKAAAKHEKIALFGRCKFEDGIKHCASGLQCVGKEDWSGNCMKKEANLFDQCAGQTSGGHWKATCPKGAVCRQSDKNYSQCLPKALSEAMDA